MSAFLWAVVTACIWGIVPVMEKTGLAGPVTPTLGITIRSLGVACGALLVCLVVPPWSALRSVGWPTALLLAGGGVLASVVGQFAFYHALKYGALNQVTPVAGAYPLVAAILSWVLLREPLTASRLLGAACVVAGVFLLRK